MSDLNYVGEKEFNSAMSFFLRIVASNTIDAMGLPQTVDATYTHDEFGIVSVVLSMDRFESRYRPEASLKIGISVKLPKCRITETFIMGSKDEIILWLRGFENYSARSEFLHKFYTEASELNEASRLL